MRRSTTTVLFLALLVSTTHVGSAHAVGSSVRAGSPSTTSTADDATQYRVRDTTDGQIVEQSTDAGHSWTVVLSPTPARAARARAVVASQGCSPATYNRVRTLARGHGGTARLYIGAGGQSGNYLEGGCNSATGGLYAQRSTGIVEALGHEGLPYDQDPVGRAPRAYTVDSVIVDPGDDATVYVHATGTGPGSPPEGLYKSMDGGQHWRAINEGVSPSEEVTNTVGVAVPAYHVGTLTIDPLRPAALTYINDTGTYTSADGGLHWQLKGSTGQPPTATATPGPTMAVAVAASGQVFRLSGHAHAAPMQGRSRAAAIPTAWTWDALSAQGTAPPVRQDFAAAWDTQDRWMLVFGGSTGSTALSDTWAYAPASNSWSARAGRPTGGFGVAGAWDPTHSVFLTFGGRTGSDVTAASSDTWAYAPGPNTWTRLWPSGGAGGPAPRSHAVVTWDPAGHRLLVFGGLSAEGATTSTAFNDLWAFTPADNLTGGAWTLLGAADATCTVSCPQPRYSAEGAWDSGSGMLRLFGGRNTAKTVLSDTWSWSPTGGWTQEDRATQPAGRAEGAVAYDSAHGAVVVGPGLSLASGNMADAWTDDAMGHSWQALPSASAPPVRRLSGWVWDDADGTFLLFGGRVSGVGPANDLWRLRPSTAAVATPTILPTSVSARGLDENRSVSDDQHSLVTAEQVVSTTQAGARYVRVNFRLGAAADWSDPALLAAYDTVVNTYLAAGVGVLGLVTAEATHSTQADWTANNAEHAGGAGDNAFLRTTFVQGALTPLLTHFHDRVKTWELWNEPNSYSVCTSTGCSGNSYIYPSNLAALLADAYTAIKDPAPGLGLSDVTLISGGVLGHSNGGVLTATNAGADYLASAISVGSTMGPWMVFMGSHGGRYPLDGVGQHLYIDQNLLTTVTDLGAYYGWVRGVGAAGAAGPTYLTEGAWSTASGGVAQSTQAQNVHLLLEAARRTGYVAQATWFQLQDQPAANLYFGLLGADGQPKPAMTSYAAEPGGLTPASPSPTPTTTATAAPNATGTPPASGSGIVTLTLHSGWNLIALPLTSSTPSQAQDLLSAVLSTGVGSIAEMAAWSSSGLWTTALAGDTRIGDFPFTSGAGYFLYADRATAVAVRGEPVTQAPLLTLSAGWSLVGLPTAVVGQTARDLLSSLNAAGLQPVEAAHWAGDHWETLTLMGPSTFSGTNFPLDQQSGYFVYNANGGAWQAQASPPTAL